MVDRLTSMPLAKAEDCADSTHAVALVILDQTRQFDPSIPAGAALPRVGLTAAAAQLAVIGQDYLAAARRTPDADSSIVLGALSSLRRSLP